MKIDKDVKKRWLLFALVNFVLIVLVFGALLAGFSAYVVTAQRNVLQDRIMRYADTLADRGAEELQVLFGSEDAGWEEDPFLLVALYTVRDNGSVGIASRSTILIRNAPALGGRVDTFQKENIGGYGYLTYTVRVDETQRSYLKVFAPYDINEIAEGKISTYAVPFAVAFVVIAAAFSLIWGYVAIKPIVAGYVKQKNFINDMSHEIRTPLAVIKGNLENVLADPEAKVGAVEEMIGNSLKEVDYMTDISAGLLNIVRGQNRSATHKESNLTEVLSEVVDLFADVATISGKALVANLEQCDIKIERESVKQLASVLIENAIKYTEEGDRIDVRLRGTKEGCVFTVADTGIGVPKSDLDRIFDRFYRGENAKDIPGTGLGLAIAAAIVEGMGGTIRAHNRVPRGLEMIVTLKRN